MHRSPAAVKARSVANTSDDFPLARQSATRFRHCSLVVIPHIEPGPYAGLKHRSVQRIHNCEHRHSGIKFVTPDERHSGQDAQVLEARRLVFESARRRHPERWTGAVRDCTPVGPVRLRTTLREKEIRLAA